MPKGLELHALLRDGAHLVERELARERHAAHTQLAAPGGTTGVVHVCLSGDVALDLRPAATHLGEKPPVLDDEGVRPQQPGPANELEHLRNLARSNGDVHRHIDARASQVRATAGLAKGLVGEVVGAAAGVEVVAQTAVDGVGAGCQRGVERLGTAGGSQELWHGVRISKVGEVHQNLPRWRASKKVHPQPTVNVRPRMNHFGTPGRLARPDEACVRKDHVAGSTPVLPSASCRSAARCPPRRARGPRCSTWAPRPCRQS